MILPQYEYKKKSNLADIEKILHGSVLCENDLMCLGMDDIAVERAGIIYAVIATPVAEVRGFILTAVFDVSPRPSGFRCGSCGLHTFNPFRSIGERRLCRGSHAQQRQAQHTQQGLAR